MSARPMLTDDPYLPFLHPTAPSVAEATGRPPRPRMRLAVTGPQRRARTSRIAHAGLLRIVLTAMAVTLCVMAYVTLTAMLTRTNYQVVRVERERVALRDETLQLEDRLARLRSRDRLAALATKLGMQEAGAYAVVEIPRPAVPAPADRGLAFFPSLAGWIK